MAKMTEIILTVLRLIWALIFLRTNPRLLSPSPRLLSSPSSLSSSSPAFILHLKLMWTQTLFFLWCQRERVLCFCSHLTRLESDSSFFGQAALGHGRAEKERRGVRCRSGSAELWQRLLNEGKSRGLITAPRQAAGGNPRSWFFQSELQRSIHHVPVRVSNMDTAAAHR